MPRKREKLLRRFGPGTRAAEEGARVWARREEVDRLAREQAEAEAAAAAIVAADADGHRCPACGYVYRQGAGDPHEGVPAGTAWADVLDTWNCPECGVRDKVDFVPVVGEAAAV